MDITGCNTVIFTNRSPAEIVRLLSASVLERWPTALVENLSDTDPEVPLPSGPHLATAFPFALLSSEDWHLLFYRDEAMIRHMDDEAYTPMADGDGPFAVIARPRIGIEFRIETLTELRTEVEPDRNVEPYSAWLCSPSLTEVTVVTPDDPDIHPFSSWTCDMVRRACGGTAIRASARV